MADGYGGELAQTLHATIHVGQSIERPKREPRRAAVGVGADRLVGQGRTMQTRSRQDAELGFK